MRWLELARASVGWRKLAQVGVRSRSVGVCRSCVSVSRRFVLYSASWRVSAGASVRWRAAHRLLLAAIVDVTFDVGFGVGVGVALGATFFVAGVGVVSICWRCLFLRLCTSSE